MGTALYPLRNLQIGLESTPGTLVAATKRLVGVSVYTPGIDREFEDFPRGVRAPVTGGGFENFKGSMLKHEGNATYQEILYPFLTGILNDAAPTGSGPYVWTFAPNLTSNASLAIKTATLEYVIEDGSTKHYQRESGYGFTKKITIEGGFNKPTKHSWEMGMRAEQSSTVTGAIAAHSRQQIPGNLWKLYIDDSWAGLGGTLKSLLIRDFTLEITTGYVEDFTLDGRADLDFTQILPEQFNYSLDMTFEHNADAATEVGKWRGTAGVQSLRFVRLIATNSGAGAAERTVQLDMAGKYMEPPDFSEENGIEIMTMKLGGEYDSTGTKIFEANVTNDLATQGAL